MIDVPSMLLIGSSGRNSGKTVLACSLINKFKDQHNMIGLKVTVIRENDGKCPRGGEGCGVCTSLESHYAITEEKETISQKDTARLLSAGAQKVYWLRVLKKHLREGVEALFNVIDSNSVIICESNSVRHAVQPGLFLMVQNTKETKIKKTALAVMDYADEIIETDGEQFQCGFDDIKIVDNIWYKPKRATAIILAGGRSQRMGQDKNLMIHPKSGKPFIQTLIDAIKPCFQEVMISANETEKFRFLDLPVIIDKKPGEGPLGGIVSAIEDSSYDINMVLASDIPYMNISFIKKILRRIKKADIVVPVNRSGYYEPLFAVYHKRILNKLKVAFASGERKIQNVFSDCDVVEIDLGDSNWLRNVNTINDYKEIGKQLKAKR